MQHSAFLINAIYSKLTKYFGIFYKIKIRNKLPPLILKKMFILHLCTHKFYMVLRYMQILVMSTYRNW